MAMALKVDTIESLLAEMALNKFKVGSWFYAWATHIVDPHNFYVVPTNCNDELATLNESQGQCSLEELKVHKTVIYRSQALNRDVRGLVVDIKNNMSRIYALDHGFVEGNVRVERIFHPLNEKTTTTPSLAHHCELYLCYPRSSNHFSDDAIDALKYYVGNERLRVYIQGKLDEKLSVTVLNSAPVDVASLLTLTGLTSFTNSLTCYPKINESVHRPLATYQHPKIEVGESFDVRVQSGDKLSSFYVMPTSFYKNYNNTRKEFNIYCSGLCKISPENFIVGAPVGVKERSSLPYQRAVILEIINPKSKAKVKLVDWGYDIVARMSRMKYVTAKVFTDTQVYALYCGVSPNFKTSEEVHRLLCKGNDFRITVEYVGLGFEKPHIVSITNYFNYSD